jgi:hypothetical protein
MDTRLTRQQAKQLKQPLCYGSVCKKHAELEGLRRVSGSCVTCAKETLNKYRQVNKERTAAQRKKDYVKLVSNPENLNKKRARDAVYAKNNRVRVYQKQRAWLAENPEKPALYAANHRAKHPDAKNADTAKRRSAKLLRTPRWLTKDHLWMIRQAYYMAKLRTKLFGFKWHVDHVVPLKGVSVSGLHVPWNLQVIPAVQNIKKSNKLVVI